MFLQVFQEAYLHQMLCNAGIMTATIQAVLLKELPASGQIIVLILHKAHFANITLLLITPRTARRRGIILAMQDAVIAAAKARDAGPLTEIRMPARMILPATGSRIMLIRIPGALMVLDAAIRKDAGALMELIITAVLPHWEAMLAVG